MKLFECIDCSVVTTDIDEYYMVHDGIWMTACPKKSGMLCIGCLEERLGRTLTAADFTDAPINHGVFPQSERLAARLATH